MALADLQPCARCHVISVTPVCSFPWFRCGCNVPAGALDVASEGGGGEGEGEGEGAEDDDEDNDCGHESLAAPTRVFDIPDATISDVGERLLALSRALDIKEDFCSYPPCESLLLEACVGGSQRPRLRHLRQQLSIAGHVQRCGA